eukprot:1159074-Pelagomonas_calceolata.AAC.2
MGLQERSGARTSSKIVSNMTKLCTGSGLCEVLSTKLQLRQGDGGAAARSGHGQWGFYGCQCETVHVPTCFRANAKEHRHRVAQAHFQCANNRTFQCSNELTVHVPPLSMCTHHGALVRDVPSTLQFVKTVNIG